MMNKGRLTSMTVVSIEKSLSSQLSFDDIVNDFVGREERKV